MALTFTTGLRNTLLDTIESTAGSAALLRIYSGTAPANANATALTGTDILATLTLPPNWMNDASGGTKTKLGSWAATAGNTGTATHFRVLNNAGSVTYIQGTVGTSGADLILGTVSIVSGATITVTGFTLTAGNS
jgi:hypothetical protein